MVFIAKVHIYHTKDASLFLVLDAVETVRDCYDGSCYVPLRSPFGN